MNLTKKDYKQLLDYYQVKYKKNISYKKIKNLGEKILAEKLCKCIKKIDKNNENKSIAICKNSVFTYKGLTFKKFTCKKNNKIYGIKRTLKSHRKL